MRTLHEQQYGSLCVWQINSLPPLRRLLTLLAHPVFLSQLISAPDRVPKSAEHAKASTPARLRRETATVGTVCVKCKKELFGPERGTKYVFQKTRKVVS